MKRAKAWTPFVQNDNNVLWVAYTAHKFGHRPSEFLGFDPDTAIAVDFDLACGKRLMEYENERDHDRLKALIRNVAAIMGAEFSDDEETVSTDAEAAEVW